MNEIIQDAAEVDTETQTDDDKPDTSAVEQNAAAEDKEAKADDDGAEKPEKPEPAKRGWQETRIAQLTARKSALERELAEARALVEQAIKPGTDAAKPASEAEIERRATELVEQREFQQKLTAWDARGTKEFPDFRDRCATLAGMGLSLAEKPDFVACIAEMDDGHKIAAHLADHPEIAMEIASGPSHKIGLRLAKISASLSKPVPVSRAPAPMEPVSGGVSTAFDLYNPKTDMETWAKKWREDSSVFKRRS